MYQINLITYRTAVNVKNARRKVMNINKGMLKRKFQSVELAREALKEFLNKIGSEVKEKDNETYIKTLFFDDVIIESEYKIIKCN
nr:MAG TPA: CtsR-like protein [Caudoviricetes sp.]